MAEKDPEFFKYLQENDKELLDFDPNSAAMDDDDEDMDDVDEEAEDQRAPVLTKEQLRKWQKALLEVRMPSSLCDCGAHRVLNPCSNVRYVLSDDCLLLSERPLT